MLENLFVTVVMQASVEYSSYLEIIKTSMNWVQCPMSSDLVLMTGYNACEHV